MNAKAIIPAIDIVEGRCVRLSQGRMEEKQVYDADPVEMAEQFAQWGARRLHVVDLDAAFGRGNNRSIIREISEALKKTSCLLEVGGGIRTDNDVRAMLAMGVHRLVLGTVLVQDLFEVQQWIRKFGNVFVASLDDRNGTVQVAGWLKDTDITVDNFLHQIKKLSLRSIAYTNISHEGMMGGVNFEAGNRVAKASHVPVVLSGGVGSESDIDACMTQADDNVCGVIVGKAVYEGSVDLKKMFKQYPSPDSSQW